MRWWYVGAGVVGAAGLAGLVALARRRQGVGGLEGIYARETAKLASTDPSEATVVWKLPPGPPPSRNKATARSKYAALCARAGGPRAWMRPMLDTTPPHGSGIDQKDWAGDPWRKPVTHPMGPRAWWFQGGTCPGCSEVCGASCYAARAQNYKDWAVRRTPWVNLCDLMSGKGLPLIREHDGGNPKFARHVVTPQEWDPPKGPQARMKPPYRQDYWSNEVDVDSCRIRHVVVRVHETGDFFDAQYARQWFDQARRYVQDYYPRELRRYLAGERRCPPTRVYWYAYTRSWRDPSILQELRQFSTLRYPEWTRSQRSPAVKWGEGTHQREQRAFGVLLSADADTGVPWVKDKTGAIMPVAYVITTQDLLKGNIGRLNRAVPGVMLQDYGVRNDVRDKSKLFGTRVCRAEYVTREMWDEGLAKVGCDPNRLAGNERDSCVREVQKYIKSNLKVGCGDCRFCRPNSAQAIAEVTWQQFVRAARKGADFSNLNVAQLKRRSPDLTYYQAFMQGPEVFRMAVKPLKTEAGVGMDVALTQIPMQRAEALRRLAFQRELNAKQLIALDRAGMIVTVGKSGDDDDPIRKRDQVA